MINKISLQKIISIGAIFLVIYSIVIYVTPKEFTFHVKANTESLRVTTNYVNLRYNKYIGKDGIVHECKNGGELWVKDRTKLSFSRNYKIKCDKCFFIQIDSDRGVKTKCNGEKENNSITVVMDAEYSYQLSGEYEIGGNILPPDGGGGRFNGYLLDGEILSEVKLRLNFIRGYQNPYRGSYKLIYADKVIVGSLDNAGQKNINDKKEQEMAPSYAAGSVLLDKNTLNVNVVGGVDGINIIRQSGIYFYRENLNIIDAIKNNILTEILVEVWGVVVFLVWLWGVWGLRKVKEDSDA